MDVCNRTMGVRSKLTLEVQGDIGKKDIGEYFYTNTRAGLFALVRKVKLKVIHT